MVEEVLLRGLVLGAVSSPRGTTRAVVVSAGMFALMHISDPAAVAPLFVLGLVLGWLRVRSGSLLPAIALHVGNNSIALLAAAAGWVDA